MASSQIATAASRISLSKRSWSVPKTLLIRPLACGELAWISLISSPTAALSNCVCACSSAEVHQYPAGERSYKCCVYPDRYSGEAGTARYTGGDYPSPGKPLHDHRNGQKSGLWHPHNPSEPTSVLASPATHDVNRPATPSPQNEASSIAKHASPRSSGAFYTFPWPS